MDSGLALCLKHSAIVSITELQASLILTSCSYISFKNWGWSCTEGILIVSTSPLPKQQALTWRPDQPIRYAIGSPHEASITTSRTCNAGMTHSPTESCESQTSHHLEGLLFTSPPSRSFLITWLQFKVGQNWRCMLSLLHGASKVWLLLMSSIAENIRYLLIPWHLSCLHLTCDEQIQLNTVQDGERHQKWNSNDQRLNKWQIFKEKWLWIF